MQVSRVAEAVPLDEIFQRPSDFDLADFWKVWCAEFEEGRNRYMATVRVSPKLVEQLHYYFGGDIRDLLAQAPPPDMEGWITLTLPFESITTARTRILGFGCAAEVLEPEALRKSVRDFANQITAFYHDK